jgi:hypothetical protein
MNKEEVSMSSKTSGAVLILLGMVGLVFTLTMPGDQRNYTILLSILILIGFILVIVPRKRQSSVQISRTAVAEPPVPAAPQKPKEQIKKECPSCNKEIILEARRCRFCGEIFDPETLKRQIEAGSAQPA